MSLAVGTVQNDFSTGAVSGRRSDDDAVRSATHGFLRTLYERRNWNHEARTCSRCAYGSLG